MPPFVTVTLCFHIDSIFFVLGASDQASIAELPIGLAVGVQGMCIGERRRIDLPPKLAVSPQARRSDSSGRRRVVIEATLLSINGVA